MGEVSLTLAGDVAEHVRVAVLAARPVRVGPSSAALLEEMELTRRKLIDRYHGRPPSEIEGLSPARELYRSFGIDPTRTRPSSEALLRRVLQGKPLPVITSAVEVCTLLSLEFLLPMGLYDADRIVGEVVLRRGSPGESYPGIRKEEVNLEGRPVLSDTAGAFGNPTSDSLRTSVTESTRAIWLVLFAPVSLARTLPAFVTRASNCLAHYLMESGATLETRVLP
jgi:DNA/RNA-binding domain of Phe-tRNA-synthetase-like protein